MPRCVLLIVIDCLRADHVSCYGYDRPTTPTLDGLAQRGVLWERAHSVCSWTRPSVCTMLTGLPPSRHGIFQGLKRSRGVLTADALSDAVPTLAETLSASGRTCAAFINNSQLDEFSGLGRGYETYVPRGGKADALIAGFRDWLQPRIAQPTFAYFHFLEAHWPYKPRRRHIAMFGGNRDTNYFRDFSARDFGRLRRGLSRGRQKLSGDQLHQLVQMYDGAVRRLDGKIKILLAILQEFGLAEDTAVCVTSDHGEEFMEHGRIGHGHSLYNELTHVPLVAVIPGGPAGVRRTQPVSQVNLAKTILEMAGVSTEFPGRDLLQEDSGDDPVVSELRIQRRYWQSLRTPRWKLHREFKFDVPVEELGGRRLTREWVERAPHERRCELYDVQHDRTEQHDRSTDPACAEVLTDLEARLDAWWSQTNVSGDSERLNEVEVDQQVEQRLRDLGYLE